SISAAGFASRAVRAGSPQTARRSTSLPARSSSPRSRDRFRFRPSPDLTTVRPRRIEAKGIRVERASKVLLRDVDVHADAGEVLGVLGPSGAGKSTLFRALVGELHADGGTVILDGEDVTRWPLWR